MNEHLMTLTYTVDDDGIWLRCDCGWERNLGFTVIVDDAVSVSNQHRDAVES